MVSIHALAAVFGQQRGMDVHDALVISLNEKGRHHEHESRQHDVINVIVVEQRGEHLRIVDVGPAEHSTWHPMAGSPVEGIGIGTVADDKCHMNVVAVLEIADDVLAVCTVARYEYGNIGCLFHGK